MRYSNKTIGVILFLLAFGLRMAAILSFENETSLFYVADSYHYTQYAINILEHGTFSMELSATPHPDNFRTPLYPLFLLPFVALKTSFYLPVIIQNLIAAAGVVVIFFLAKKLFQKRVAFLGSLLFALEPFGALISGQVMTEPIFTALFVPAILLFGIYIKEKKSKQLLLAAVLLALAALTRPVAFYLFLFIPIAVLLAHKKPISWRRMVVPLAAFFVVMAPWLLFNWTILKTPEISSLPGFDLYAYHGRYFDAWRGARGATDRLPEVDLSVINDTFDARPIAKIKKIGLSYIFSHPVEYSVYHLSRMPRLFTDSGYASILNGLPFVHAEYDSVKGGVLDYMLSGSVAETITRLKRDPVLFLLLTGDLFFVAAALLAFLHPIISKKVRGGTDMSTLFFVLFILLYTFLASPIGGARLRIPINALLFLLAIDAAFLLKKAFNQRTIQPH